MLDDPQSQVIAFAVLCLAIVIFRRLSPWLKLALFFIGFGTGTLAAIAGIANGAMARMFN